MLNKTTARTIRTANTAILNEIIAEVRLRQRTLQAEIGSTFRVGDAVYFDSRTGVRVTGTIVKINQKTIKVATKDSTWKVSPSLLRAA